MAITPLFDFLKAAVKFAKVAPEDLDDALLNQADIAYHKKLVGLGGTFGVVGLFVGIFCWIPELARESQGKASGEPLLAYLIVPIMAVVIGILFGTSLACLLAPTKFFQNSLGERLLRLVGTRNVILARIVSLIVVLVTGGLLAFVFVKNLLS